MKIKALSTKLITGGEIEYFPLGHMDSSYTHIGSIVLGHETSGTIDDARALRIIKQAIEAGAEIVIEFPEVNIRLS